jgi:hypothetical protein
MNKEDSDELKVSESSSVLGQDRTQLIVEPENKTQVTTEDLVGFLDQDLDPARTQLVMGQIRTDPGLRTEAVALQSTWDMLDLLPRESPSIGVTEQAAKIIEADATSQWQRSIVARSLAFLMSIGLVFSGWYLGRNLPEKGRLALIESIDQLTFLDMMRVASEPFFLDKLANDSRATVFDQIRPLNRSDIVQAVSEKRKPPKDSSGWEQLEAENRRYLELPASSREPLVKMADMVQAMPEQDQYKVLTRLFGLACWYDNLADQERKNFDRLSGQQRWNKAVSSADQWLRQKDAIRKQSFTLTNFNRPEYVMDLAFERKSRNQRSDTTRKSSRVNQLAQALETAPKGTFPASEFLKNNPPPRLAAKNELLKQQRERKRNEYLEVLRQAGPLTTDPAQLESFVAQLPPWLVDVVDPLPPDEARRLLSILKILVDQTMASDDQKNAG